MNGLELGSGIIAASLLLLLIDVHMFNYGILGALSFLGLLAGLVLLSSSIGNGIWIFIVLTIVTLSAWVYWTLKMLQAGRGFYAKYNRELVGLRGRVVKIETDKSWAHFGGELWQVTDGYGRPLSLNDLVEVVAQMDFQLVVDVIPMAVVS